MQNLKPDRATELAELLLGLPYEELITAAGRQTLAEALQTTLDLVGGRPVCCANCPLTRPGAIRAVRNLGTLLADAAEHAEYIAGFMVQPVLAA